MFTTEEREVAERQLELANRVILASEDWAKGYKKDTDNFQKLIKHEAKLERLMRKYFRELKDRLPQYINWNLYNQQNVKAYSYNVIVDVDYVDDEEELILMNILHDTIAANIAVGAQAGEALYNIELGLNEFSEAIMKVAENYTNELVRGINETTKAKLQQSIATSIRLGEDQTDAASRINAIVGDMKRARTIARTEAVRSYSKGITTFGVESNATGKIWELSSDPCEICKQNDTNGEYIPVDQDFPSGDSEAPAHPNCRCGVSLIHDYS